MDTLHMQKKAARNNVLNFFLLCPCLFLISCAGWIEEGTGKAQYTEVSYEDLDGWRKDTPREALDAFKRSCARIAKRKDWKDVCVEAQKTPNTDDAARAYFERAFIPYALSGDDGGDGLFTGYYVPELRGSIRKKGQYKTPLYAVPDDLILVNLGDFSEELKGKKILGKVQKSKLVPYDKRAAIAKGSLVHRGKPIVWVDDPVDAFFLEIQGSGRVHLENGKYLLLGYANKNGHAYTSIGRAMADRGDLPRPVTMEAIRKKLAENPKEARETMDLNASYVFFRRMPGLEVVGAQNVELTPKRSLAGDRRFVPLGAPIWLDTKDGKGADFKHLMVAQDTGGAIKGAVRGDVFWGSGVEATEQAGSMQSRGRAYILLPKTVNPNDQ